MRSPERPGHTRETLACPICRHTLAGQRPKGHQLYEISPYPCERCQERINRFLDDLDERRKEATQ
jgi:uncharacterized protein YbaR (Trm112 family)